MRRKPNSDAPGTKPPSSKRHRPSKAAQALIEAVEEGADSISHKVEDLVEKLAPYPLQGG